MNRFLRVFLFVKNFSFEKLIIKKSKNNWRGEQKLKLNFLVQKLLRNTSDSSLFQTDLYNNVLLSIFSLLDKCYI